MTIHLTKPMTLKGAEVSEPAIDFEALTGADLVAVEREVRVMGGGQPPPSSPRPCGIRRRWPPA